VATSRAKRPHEDQADRPVPKKKLKYKEDCPFCNLADFPQKPDTLRLPNNADTWQVHIFENKYPALQPKEDYKAWNKGPYRAVEAVGYHELLATRGHDQEESQMSLRALSVELEALVLRYRQLRVKETVNYVQVIRNHGQEAGASLEHPHLQIFTTPVIPSDIQDMLMGAERYAAQHENRSAYEDIVKFELESGDRMIWENDQFVIFAPYASRVPYEMWIVPRDHSPFFDTIGPDQRESLAEALQQAVRRMYVGLQDPPFNYVIYSAPCGSTGTHCNPDSYKHFRWHIQVLPRIGVWGGFEIATGLEITQTLPEEAAKFFRDVDCSWFVL
jgi:UDPglucose--hexose-1-phosphate uridylyltransferase